VSRKGRRVFPHTPGAVRVEIPSSKPGRKPRVRWYVSDEAGDRALLVAATRAKNFYLRDVSSRRDRTEASTPSLSCERDAPPSPNGTYRGGEREEPGDDCRI
jgi:hypothetical protein